MINLHMKLGVIRVIRVNYPTAFRGKVRGKLVVFIYNQLLPLTPNERLSHE